MMRILVTGSRDWSTPSTIGLSLAAASVEHDDHEITLVSGACPTGADRMAEEFAQRNDWTIERHPANWDLHGKRAGYVRNAEMVAAGADICLAYIRDHSRGATMTANLARQAGIPVRTFEEWGE